jgi:3-oxoacyl-[acyl-carrier protein] reductase
VSGTGHDGERSAYERLRLDGQRMVVAGAASGIGRATALLLAQRGAHLLLLDRDGPGVESTATAVAEAGGGADARAVDVTDAAALDAALDVARSWPQLHGLLNCVGITGETNRPAHEVDVADFDRVVATNLRSAFLLTKYAVPLMLASGYGRVLHVASIAGKEGNAGMVSYSATKAGLIGLVKSAAKDYARTGVIVNALAPAVIRTPLVDAMPAAQVEYMTSRIPMARCASLDEVAELAAWVLSPACSFTTGFTFDLSGGRATY